MPFVEDMLPSLRPVRHQSHGHLKGVRSSPVVLIVAASAAVLCLLLMKFALGAASSLLLGGSTPQQMVHSSTAWPQARLPSTILSNRVTTAQSAVMEDAAKAAAEAAQQTIVVALANEHWWPKWFTHEWKEKCSLDGQLLGCRYVNLLNSNLTLRARHRLAARADALLYHLCPNTPRPTGSRPDIPIVAMSAESSVNYPCLNSQSAMQMADIEMTYKSCAQVQILYYNSEYQPLPQLQAAPLPVEKKLNAILYINSNCKPLSGRQQIMQGFQQLLDQQGSTVELHSYGMCDRNMGDKAIKIMDKMGKIKLGRYYKFCLAMENSIEMDYVSEKVYHALESGCVPIYYGAPNVLEYVPEPDSIIDYAQLGSPAALLTELERLVADDAAYNAKLAWKSKTIEQLAPGFQQVYATAAASDKCRLCQVVARHKVRPQKYSLCHANVTWSERNASLVQAQYAAVSAAHVPNL